MSDTYEDLDIIVLKNGETLWGDILRISDESLTIKWTDATRTISLFNIRSYTMGTKTCILDETYLAKKSESKLEKKLVNGRQEDSFLHELNKLIK